MKLDRTKNAKRNIFFSLANKFVSLLMPFVLRTMVIRRLGAEYLGLENLFASILQTLNLAELGFSSAIVYSMYQPVADNDKEKLCALLNFYRHVYRKVGACFLFAGLAAVPFLPGLIHGSRPKAVNIYLLYAIYLANSAASYLLFAYRQSLLDAYQRVDVVQIVNMSVNVCMYGGQMAVLALTGDCYLYAGVMLASTAAANLCSYLCTKKLFPDISCKGRLEEAEIGAIYQKVKGLLVNRLCGVSRNTFDSIFLSMFFGLSLTAAYGNYYQIMSSVSGIMRIITLSVQAGIGNSIVTETVEKNYRDLGKFNFVYMWIAGWFAACLLCLYQPFTAAAFGEDMLLPFGAAVLFCVYFYLLKYGDILSAYYTAKGLWWENRYRSVAEAAANIVLNYLLGRYFGVYGVLCATILSVFFINFLWGARIIFHQYFGIRLVYSYYIRHAGYSAAAVFVCAVTYAVCAVFRGYGIKTLFLRAAVCVIVPNVLFFAIYRRTKMFRIVKAWLKQVRKL